MQIEPQVTNEASSWIERYVRAGYFVKGIVYVLVGALALQVALGVGGRTTTTSGALTTIARQPFGQALLVLTGIGLVGYALWRILQGVFDVEGRGSEAKALLKRFGYVASGSAYGSLAFEAFRLVVGAARAGEGDSTELWTARVLAAPFGGWLVGAGAAVAFALAGNALYVALRGLYRKKLMLGEMGPAERLIADIAAVAGLIGRGAVFALVGLLLARAALDHDPEEAGSSEEALDMLIRWPAGPWLLGAVALGLVAYGAYAAVQARYRRIDV